ncbi:UTP--glucose-1-phosphate uridylyltransferase AglF [uncultured archaeon]|nr:UTP--glucose-1-phosphate uridylyltransferase AglF [uncultured archaeon]
MQGVVIAAGRGMRLRPITDKIPKCMFELKGRPMLEHVLDRLIAANANEILLVVGYKREVIEDHFGPEYGKAKLRYFVQEQAKGTSHALSLVEDYVRDMFILTNSDVLAETKYYKMLGDIGEYKKADAIMLSRTVHDPWRFGVLKAQGNSVLDIVEKPMPGEEPSNLVNAGIYGFEKSIFEAVRETPLSARNEYELVDSLKIFMAKKNRVEHRLIEGPCIDIEHFHDVEEANELDESEFPK